MPGFDRTGPVGKGQRTGRGFGPCGMGLGWRRGFGWGGGCPVCGGWPLAKVDRKQALSDYREGLKEELKGVEKELEEVGKEE